MSKKINVLVFPCGSEIGLEIHRSLKYSIHINLFGANSVDDHGKFVYENYIPNLPFVDDEDFIPSLKEIVTRYKIDAIYPAMDAVITRLSVAEAELGCRLIGSPVETNKTCLSKRKTYQLLTGVVTVPQIFENLSEVEDYPVFMKPEVGYGARGAKLIHNLEQGKEHLASYPTCLILENLPGQEYTIDCFTDRNRKLLFSKARVRRRISNGISVNTIPVEVGAQRFEDIALRINEKMHFQGAWFYQAKENDRGELALLEVAARLGGSSSLFRNLGVNFALLSIFDAFGYDVNVFANNYGIELDRALDNKYKLDIHFDKAYVDFDDCLLLGDQVNTSLVSLLYQFLNEGKKLILITKHDRDINQTLAQYKLFNIFHEIIHLEKGHFKYEFMDKEASIFIDDSYSERYQVHEHLGIPVFAPDNIECLLN